MHLHLTIKFYKISNLITLYSDIKPLSGDYCYIYYIHFSSLEIYIHHRVSLNYLIFSIHYYKIWLLIELNGFKGEEEN